MRQAGRYLPEFKEIRSKNKNFIDLCLNSELSSDISLQPIKRFNLDSAIIFSDILMVPYALNQKVEFIKDQGPILEDFNLKKFMNNNKTSFTQKLYPVYKAIQKTREKLDKKKIFNWIHRRTLDIIDLYVGDKKAKEILIIKKLKQKNQKLI